MLGFGVHGEASVSGMEEGRKSQRVRERLKLALPVRVHCRESAEHEWVELSRLVDVTPFGARFTLARPTERGRLMHLTMPLPRQLRCFDHIEDQYRVWALVRHAAPYATAPKEQAAAAGASLRFNVGVAFTGKHPPASYQRDPTTLYEVDRLAAEGNLWAVRERPSQAEGGPQLSRSQMTRIQMAVGVLVELFDERGAITASEQTVTENISRRGASVMTSLDAGRGRFVRVTSAEHGLSVLAAVRARRTGPDGIPRLHLEFVDRQWPLDGID
jgi:hypothetical protein